MALLESIIFGLKSQRRSICMNAIWLLVATVPAVRGYVSKPQKPRPVGTFLFHSFFGSPHLIYACSVRLADRMVGPWRSECSSFARLVTPHMPMDEPTVFGYFLNKHPSAHLPARCELQRLKKDLTPTASDVPHACCFLPEGGTELVSLSKMWCC